MDIFESQKGQEKLAFKGYRYVVHKVCSNFIRWKCCKKNSHKCPCVLKTSLDKEHIIKIDHEHKHNPNMSEIHAEKIKMEIRNKAKTSKSTPAQLFSEVVMGLPEDTLEELPKETSIKKTIQNQRTKNFPNVPDHLNDLKIEGMYLYILYKISNYFNQT